ncbi:MAG: hypothetical protein PW843_10730 [Azospirillaceae bacterium]|nr:hypothetical protein [Azospirillaceae bacterium]
MAVTRAPRLRRRPAGGDRQRRLAVVLRQVALDPDLRRRLEDDPVAALGQLGVALNPREQAAVAGRRLSRSLGVNADWMLMF